jgi:hypothetical protein
MKTASPKTVGGLGNPSYSDYEKSGYEATLVGVNKSFAYYF